MGVRVQGLLRLIRLVAICVCFSTQVGAQEKVAPAVEPLDEAGMRAELQRLQEICGNLGLSSEADLWSQLDA